MTPPTDRSSRGIPADRIGELRALASDGKGAQEIACAMHVKRLDVVHACGTFGISLGRINDHFMVGPRAPVVPGNPRAQDRLEVRREAIGCGGHYVERGGRMVWQPAPMVDPETGEVRPYLYADKMRATGGGMSTPWEPGKVDKAPVAPGPRRKSPSWGSTGRAQKRAPNGWAATNMQNAPTLATNTYPKRAVPLDDPQEAERLRKIRVTKRERPKKRATASRAAPAPRSPTTHAPPPAR